MPDGTAVDCPSWPAPALQRMQLAGRHAAGALPPFPGQIDLRLALEPGPWVSYEAWEE